MKTNQGKQFQFRTHRIFSEAVRRQTVKDIESGKCSVFAASQELFVSPTAIYKWIYRYSRYLEKNKVMVVEDKSESFQRKALEQKVKELEAALGRKQLELDFLNKLIEVAEEKFHLDIKKKASKRPLSGSVDGEEKNTDTK